VPDSIADGISFGHRQGDSHGQGLCHPEANGHGVPEGDLNRQTDGFTDRNSRSLGRTHPNRNL
jgi:hypothetical protein